MTKVIQSDVGGKYIVLWVYTVSTCVHVQTLYLVNYFRSGWD